VSLFFYLEYAAQGQIQEWDEGAASPPASVSVTDRLIFFGYSEHSRAKLQPQLTVSLPYVITAASPLTVFRRKLKTHLFRNSYPDIIM